MKPLILSSLVITLILAACASTETRETTATTAPYTHINFKKWNRDPATCCEATGKEIAIASGGPLSSTSGIEIYEAGGNIVDVAVATALALNVERPQSTSIGGGGFMTLALADGTTAFIDFRETAPRNALPSIYLDAKGEPIPRATLDGAKAVAIPGMVAGLYDIHKKWGKLPWKRVVQPATRLARLGFPVYPTIEEKIVVRKTLLTADPYTRKLFFKESGEPLVSGDLLVQSDLAATLDLIAEKGKKGFYSGTVAKRIAETIKERGGVLDEKDLADYKVKFRQPIKGSFKGYTFITAPPPSAGGVLMTEMLNILEPYDLAKMSESPAQYIHLLSEVMKRGYADRSDLIGDPDTLPASKGKRYPSVLTKTYADRAREAINETKATPWNLVRPGAFLPKETHGTTHLSIIDSKGNAVAATLTLNTGNFGSAVAVPGTGVILNNEMDDFTLLPGRENAYGLVSSEINGIKPGRRPVSSMTPTIVFKDGKPKLAVGAAGGSKIISAILQVTLNTLFLSDGNLKKAIFEPRMHHQWLPDKLDLEGGVPSAERAKLEAMGHVLVPPAWETDVEAVVVSPSKQLISVFDPRDQGGVAAK